MDSVSNPFPRVIILSIMDPYPIHKNNLVCLFSVFKKKNEILSSLWIIIILIASALLEVLKKA